MTAFSDEELQSLEQFSSDPIKLRLARELLQARRDALRYEYLRATPPWKSRVSIVNVADTPDDTALLCGADLDAAIDAALAEGK